MVVNKQDVLSMFGKNSKNVPRNVPWLIDKSGYDFDFDTVILDELSSFKDRRTNRFKSLKR